MDVLQELIASTLLLKDSNVFNHYFKDFGVFPHPESLVHERAETLYKEIAKDVYRNTEFPAFKEFVEAYRALCQRQRALPQQTVHPPQTQCSDEGQSRICNKWNLIRPKVSVIPPVSRNKRKDEEFNIVDFLLKKKRSDDYFPLTFQSDEEVQDDLTILESPDKKKLDAIGDGILKKMAVYLELLNKERPYRILDVQYERR